MTADWGFLVSSEYRLRQLNPADYSSKANSADQVATQRPPPLPLLKRRRHGGGGLEEPLVGYYIQPLSYRASQTSILSKIFGWRIPGHSTLSVNAPRLYGRPLDRVVV